MYVYRQHGNHLILEEEIGNTNELNRELIHRIVLQIKNQPEKVLYPEEIEPEAIQENRLSEFFNKRLK